MKLPGIVTNVTAFGAFVDIGVHQDGLVHVSQLADRFVKDPNEVVKVQQHVEVTVLEVDLPRNASPSPCEKASPPAKPGRPAGRGNRTGPSTPQRPRPAATPTRRWLVLRRPQECQAPKKGRVLKYHSRRDSDAVEPSGFAVPPAAGSNTPTPDQQYGHAAMHPMSGIL